MERKSLIMRLKREVVIFMALAACIGLSNCEKKGIAPKPELLPATVSFNNNILPMLTTYCAMSGCHSRSQPAARIDLSMPGAYSKLLTQNMIDTSDPANSRLYTCLFKPMPPWGELINYDKDLILKWIEQGAKNN